MMSGTSMAAPHIAGLAALMKQKFPTFSPSAIGSALSTTASLRDKKGGPIMAQRAYTNPDLNQSPATPFDMGSGFVNATAALDPGLIFDCSESHLFIFHYGKLLVCLISSEDEVVYRCCSMIILLMKELLENVKVQSLNKCFLADRIVYAHILVAHFSSNNYLFMW